MSIEAMKMALLTLEGWANHGNWMWPESALEQAKRNTVEAITALRAAIEQAEKQEPFGYFKYALHFGAWVQNRDSNEGVAFYTAPQRVCSGCDKTNTNDSMWAVYCVDCWKQREWVGLTDDEIVEIANAPPVEDARPVHSFARAIEAKLKEKNT